jgi:hypothetical protein
MLVLRPKNEHYVTDVQVVGSVCMKIIPSGNLLGIICVIFFQDILASEIGVYV